MNTRFSLSKGIIILTLVNLLIVLSICLVKYTFNLYTIGTYISYGGFVMMILSGLLAFGAPNVAEIDMQNSLITKGSSTQLDKLGQEYLKSREKNMDYTILMALSSISSIVIGLIVRLF
jgi:hypothetical protein